MSTRSHHDLLYHVLAPAFLIFTAFISFLTYNNYSPFAPEVWICLAGLGVVAVLCGLVGIAGGWPVRVVMTAGLVVLFVDLQFNWFDGFNPWPELRVVGVFLLALFLSFALRRHLSRIVTAVFATLLISTIVLGAVDGGSLRDSGPATVAESGPAADPELPILVHFILDEHIGVEGIPDGVPHGKEMRAFLRDFFDRYGFRVFARAYSHYANTNNSLANLVNFSSEAADGAFTSGPEPHVVLRNEYFQLLGRKGYKIHVYQSDYMDFCSSSKEYITRCANQEITGVEAIEAQDIPVSDKVGLIYRRFADLSALKSVAGAYYEHSRAALRSAGWTLPEWWFKEARLGPLPVMPVFDDVTMDVARASPGNMFFVYLVMPHFPYVYDSMCRLRPVSEWEWSLNPAPMPANDHESRARRYGLYLEQMRCLYRKLDAMFEAWQKAAIFDELTIVIHGDHGSRIYQLRPKAESREKLSHADYIDAFSTLFAVKGPRHPPGYDRRVAAIEQLLKEVVDERSSDDHSDSEQIPYVFLKDRPDQALLRQPLPVFGDER